MSSALVSYALADLRQRTFYARWLQSEHNLKHSTLANYLNSLVSVISYVYAETEVPEATHAMEPSPLAMAINLRGQACSPLPTCLRSHII